MDIFCLRRIYCYYKVITATEHYIHNTMYVKPKNVKHHICDIYVLYKQAQAH